MSACAPPTVARRAFGVTKGCPCSSIALPRSCIPMNRSRLSRPRWRLGRMPRWPFPSPRARSWWRRSSLAARARRSTSSRVRTLPTARLVRLRRMWARSTWRVSRSARIIPGRTPSPMTPWLPRVAPPSPVWRKASRASWSLPRVRSCVACPRHRAVIGHRRRLRWGRRSPLSACPSCWLAWATRVRMPPTCRDSFACTATRLTCGPRRRRRLCAWSFSVTRSTAFASWSPRPGRPSATRMPSRSRPCASLPSPTMP